MSDDKQTVVMEIEVQVKSPIHLSSGRADVVIDAEVAHDQFGIPYFSARRFKGLLYESALEVVEMAEQCGKSFADRVTLEELFHHESESDMQLCIMDMYAAKEQDYSELSLEWQYLQNKYPDIINPREVLEEFTSIRYQTSMKDGIAKDGSLHNMRVVDEGNNFYGKMTLFGANEKAVNLIVLALRNLRSAGLKRNRGFGQIECHVKLEDGRTDDAIVKKALK